MICNNEDRVQQSIRSTEEMFGIINDLPNTDYETLINAYLCSISTYLKDISLSLAVLADSSVHKGEQS